MSDSVSASKSYDLPSSYEVFRWPEFIAFAKRLGIPLDLLILDVSIHLVFREAVTIDLKLRGEDMDNGGVEDREVRQKQLDEWVNPISQVKDSDA